MEPDERTLDLHWLLLRLAGSLPDELIVSAGRGLPRVARRTLAVL